MKVIVAGSRTIQDYQTVKARLDYIFKARTITREPLIEFTEIVSGGQRSWNPETKSWYGVDHFGEVWAEENNIPIKRFPADWEQYGKAAGPIRNREMALYADVLIAIKEGESKGTKNMIKEMERLNKPRIVFDVSTSYSEAID